MGSYSIELLFRSDLCNIFDYFYFSLNVSETLYQHRINKYMGLNQQLYDLGLPLIDLYKLNAIKVNKDKIKKSSAYDLWTNILF